MTVTVLLRNIGTLHFVLLGGFSTAVPIRVGNLLGSGDAVGAKFSAIVGGGLQTAGGLLFSVAVCLMGPLWAAWFHLTQSGTELLLVLIPLAFFLYAGISIGCFALRSMCNGLALVRVPAFVQIVSFYPVGLLVGGGLAMEGVPFLGFAPLGIEGLWYGTALGYVVMVVWLLVYCMGIDWREQARLAVARSGSSGDSDAKPGVGHEEGEDDGNEAAPLIA
jgi:MATE family multidrug resistance protein